MLLKRAEQHLTTVTPPCPNGWLLLADRTEEFGKSFGQDTCSYILSFAVLTVQISGHNPQLTESGPADRNYHKQSKYFNPPKAALTQNRMTFVA